MLERRVLCLLAVSVATIGACARDDAARATDTARDTTAPATAVSRPPGTDWDTDLGAFLVVPSDSDNSAVVLLPSGDDTLPRSTRVTLVNVAGDSMAATLSRTDSIACGDAPLVRLSGIAPSDWAIGMAARSAELIRIDSIGSLPSADSARLAADVARMASALPMPRGSRFGGLPFAVVSAGRFQVDDQQYVVAHLARRLNQEAQPLEERTLVIAERPASSGEPYAVAYSQRSHGTEDTAEHFDLLAGFRAHGTVLLLIARDQLARTRYELLSRDTSGAWRVRWSRTLSC